MRQASAPEAPVLYADSADGALIAYRTFPAVASSVARVDGDPGRHAAVGAPGRRVSAGDPPTGRGPAVPGRADDSGVPDDSAGLDGSVAADDADDSGLMDGAAGADGSVAADEADDSGLMDGAAGADVPGPADCSGGAEASGVPVLLVHGFASNARVTWEGTGWVGELQRAGHTVITVDLRGHGASDKPAEASAYSPERLGEDLAAVLDSSGADRADVVAYSMGNRVLSAFATAAPQRLRRAVVGGAGPNELFASWDLDEARGVLLRDEPALTPLIEQVLRPAIDAGADREALLACIEGVAGAPLTIPVEVPTLFVAGELDPVPDGIEEFARARGSEVVRIPGRDHVSTLTSRAFKSAVLTFLA